MANGQVTLGLGLGQRLIGKSRREHYEDFAFRSGYKTLSEFILETLDKATNFNEQEVLQMMRSDLVKKRRR